MFWKIPYYGSSSGLLASTGNVIRKRNTSTFRTPKGRKKKSKEISGCLGLAVSIHDRAHAPNPYSFACSLRCRHPIHNIKKRISISSIGKSDEWTSENIYKKYTETDSRPMTPDNNPRLQRSATIIPSVVVENRKCITPEPETKQCQFHQRRVLILDLRRVKSVDALIHQDSVTTGTSIDSTYEDDDKSSSTVNLDSLGSVFHHLSTRNLSVSRSTTPKARLQVRRLKKSKERSTSPIVYERSSSPKILEGEMAERRQEGGIYLPPDFVSFIDKNYERMFEVQEKIKQLYESSNKSTRKLLKRSETKSIDSSVSSDHDISKIITATLVPKSALMESYESVEAVEDHIKEWKKESFDSDKEYLNYLANQYPLAFLSGFKNAESSLLAVTGIPIQLSTRLQRSLHKILFQSTLRNNKKSEKKVKAKRKKRSKNNYDISKSSNQSQLNSETLSFPTDFPSIDQIALEIYNRYFISNKNSQLTLPPLHSSVLTLLGQRSPTKASPRTGLCQGNQHPQQLSTSKHKKLRRHGRRRKSPSQTKESQPSSETADGRVLKPEEEPTATQLSGVGYNPEDFENANAKNKDEHFKGNRKSLFEILDENLTKTHRKYYKSLANLDQDIEEMKEKFIKKDILLNPSKISMKEDIWLSLPRIGVTPLQVTFSAPGDPRKLKSLNPLEYLQTYVTISNPRKHLYSLVFRRYRTLENPTGKTITTQVVQKALSEVMGETLSLTTIKDLFICLNIDSNGHEINETEFYGICAFCERVYSKYSMENCEECYSCSKYTGQDKTRCHKSQKSLIEQADFEYLSKKLRDNEIGHNLKRLIQSLCDTHRNT